MFRVGRTRRLHPIENRCNKYVTRVIVFLLLTGIPAFAIYQEFAKAWMKEAFTEAQTKLVNYGDVKHPLSVPSSENSLVYITSENASPNRRVSDPDFNVDVESALRIHRNTEYCQWQEHSSDSTYEDSDGNEHTTRTYYYTKGWHPYRIQSLFFDQPAAHHNPQNEYFPSTTFAADQVLIKDPYQNVKYTIKDPELIAKAYPLTRLLFAKSNLTGFYDSPAESENFRYIGGSYFYRAHVPSTLETFLRGFGMGFEGSLLDFQLGDLFSQCNAGDIRVSFESVDLSRGASAIASDGGMWKTMKNYKVGMLKAEFGVSAATLLQSEISNQRWVSLLGYGLLALWSLGVAKALLSNPPSQTETTSLFLARALALFGASISLFKVFAWGPLHDFSILLFGVCVSILFFLRSATANTSNSSQPRRTTAAADLKKKS